jgi:hypothetical protein
MRVPSSAHTVPGPAFTGGCRRHCQPDTDRPRPRRRGSRAPTSEGPPGAARRRGREEVVKSCRPPSRWGCGPMRSPTPVPRGPATSSTSPPTRVTLCRPGDSGPTRGPWCRHQPVPGRRRAAPPDRPAPAPSPRWHDGIEQHLHRMAVAGHDLELRRSRPRSPSGAPAAGGGPRRPKPVERAYYQRRTRWPTHRIGRAGFTRRFRAAHRPDSDGSEPPGDSDGSITAGPTCINAEVLRGAG